MENIKETKTQEKMIPSEILMEEIGIKKDAYYRDINYLGIENTKDESGRGAVSVEDAERIKALREWVERTGSRKGFLEEVEGKSSTLSVRKKQNIINREEPNYDEIYVQADEPTSGYEDEFLRGAFELKAREIAMPDLVKRAIADQVEEDDLPMDLQEKIWMAREAANPKFLPQQVAEKLLNNYREKSAI